MPRSLPCCSACEAHSTNGSKHTYRLLRLSRALYGAQLKWVPCVIKWVPFSDMPIIELCQRLAGLGGCRMDGPFSRFCACRLPRSH